MRVDETGRIYTDLGVGEHGQQLGLIGMTMIGRRILLSGILYHQDLTDDIVVTCAMGNNIIDKYIIEPVTMLLSKPIDLTKIPFNELITVTPLAIKQWMRIFYETFNVVPTAFPSLLKVCIETMTLTISLTRSVTHKIYDAVVVTPSIFRTWLSIKMLTQPTYVTPTAYKNPLKRLAAAISVVDSKFVGRYKELIQAVSVACAMGGRSITHRCIEAADMITEQMKMLVRIIQDEIVNVNVTALKQPMRSLYETSTITDTIKKIPSKLLAEAISVVDYFKTGFIQHCDEAIIIACAMGNRAISKLALEAVNLTITKPISLIRKFTQTIVFTDFADPTKNIFLRLTQAISVNPFVNGKYLGLALFTAKQTVDKVLNVQTLADVRTAAVYKVGHVGSQLDSMKKATITTLKKKTGIYKLGDEQS